MRKYIFLFIALTFSFYSQELYAYEVKSLEDSSNVDKLLVVEVPEIRKKLQTPITVDFRDVNLGYVLDFL